MLSVHKYPQLFCILKKVSRICFNQFLLKLGLNTNHSDNFYSNSTKVCYLDMGSASSLSLFNSISKGFAKFGSMPSAVRAPF